ncbi:MAG: transposase [Deltaproteobacteria bacterium]|jgi:transposase|nr:transposase [Deltaproteobacteria bacterium]
MAFLFLSPIRGIPYIYGAVSYRREDNGMPTRKSVCLGKIDLKTRLPIFNDKYLPWLKDHNLTTEEAFKDYISKTNNKYNINLDYLNKKENLEINEKNFSIDELRKSPSKCFGTLYLFNYIIKKICLYIILYSIFPDLYEQIITLVYFYIIEADPAMYCRFFALKYDTYIDADKVSSQRISELLSKISYYQKIEFYERWGNLIKEKEYLALDSTSISTYSNNMPEAKFGHNKQGDNLKQVNLCLLFGEESGLPVFSTTYDGSLNDVRTLINVLKRSSLIQNLNYKLVLDRGYYSKKNLLFMIESKFKHKFIISIPATTNLKYELIDKNINIIDNINYYINYNDELLYGTTQRIKWENHYLYAHIFNDYNKIHNYRPQIINDINSLYSLALEDPESFLKLEEYKNYIIIKKNNKYNIYKVLKNQDAYSKALLREGWFVFLSNSIKDTQDALKIYRKRDVIEKAFDICKNHTEQARLRVHNSLKMENKIFIGFLSLIITSQIHKVMFEKFLYRKYTMKELFAELDLIQVTRIKKYSILTPLSKNQINIYSAFDCPLPQEDL